MGNKGMIQVFRLTIPLFVELVLKTLIGSVNTLMLSRISDSAAASVAVSNQILNVILAFSTMFASGSMIITSQAIGSANKKEEKEVTILGAIFSLSIGAVWSFITLFFSEQLVRIVGLENVLVADAAQYLRIIGGTSVIQFMSAYCSVHLRCRGRAYLPMLSTIGINILNIIGSFLVVSTSLAAIGVVGISIVRVISECFGLFILVIPLFNYPYKSLKFKQLNLKRYMGKLVKISVSFGVEGLSYMIAKLVTVAFITTLPITVLSAKTYAQTISSYNYLLGAAVAQASQIVAGHMIGAKSYKESELLIKRVAGIILGCNLFFSVMFLLLYKKLLGIFTSSDEVIYIAHQVMLIDVFIAIGRSQGHAYGHALKAAGYVIKPMIIAILGIWGLSVGAGFVLTVVCKLGIIGIWMAEMIDEWIRAGLLYSLWIRRKWITEKQNFCERRQDNETSIQ